MPDSREAVIEIVTDAMLSGGLSLIGSRTPEEIADRYLEKQALDAAPIPAETVALLQDYLSGRRDGRRPRFDQISDRSAARPASISRSRCSKCATMPRRWRRCRPRPT